MAALQLSRLTNLRALFLQGRLKTFCSSSLDTCGNTVGFWELADSSSQGFSHTAILKRC